MVGYSGGGADNEKDQLNVAFLIFSCIKGAKNAVIDLWLRALTLSGGGFYVCGLHNVDNR